MPIVVGEYTNDPTELYHLGVARAEHFCHANGIKMPKVKLVPWTEWHFAACAYYRPNEGIVICIRQCGRLAPVANCQLWSWPGNTVDREPYGVIAHELGHHCDVIASGNRHTYFGDYSKQVFDRANEKPITNYDGHLSYEWFAEMFRLFVTNAYLLKLLRPRTFKILTHRWKPVSHKDWRYELGSNVPPRVVKAIENKLA